jgi:hypothetical protein
MDERIEISAEEFLEILNGETSLNPIENEECIVIKNCVVKDSLNIYSIRRPKVILIIDFNCCFNSHVVFNDCIFKRIIIGGINVNFKSSLGFRDNSKINKVIIRNCNILYNLGIEECETNFINIEKIKVHGEFLIDTILSLEQLNISASNIKKIKIKEISENCIIDISSNHNNKTNIEKIKFYTNCPINIGKNGFSTILDSIYLKGGLPRNQNIIFEKIQTKNLNFEDFNNLGYIKFNKLNSGESITGNIILENSDLGSFSILDSNLKTFKLYTRGSKLNNLFIASTEFIEPENINSDTNNSTQALYTDRDKIDVFSQLKKVFENIGNNVKSTTFHLFELELRLKELNKKLLNPNISVETKKNLYYKKKDLFGN